MIASECLRIPSICVDSYTDINKIRTLLLYNPVVVVNHKQSYYGLITPQDIINTSYRNTIDCVVEKPFISYDMTLEEVFYVMKQENLQVLPVQKHGNFLGTICEKDILDKKDSEINDYKQFVDRIIHNTNGIIGSIRNFAYVLKNHEFNSQNQEYIDSIIKSTQVASEIVHQFQTFESFSTRSSKTALEYVDLNRLAQDVCLLKQMQASVLGIQFVHCIEKESHNKKIDITAIKEILENLISNAFKFTKAGETVTVKTSTVNRSWHLEVRDTGIGIPKDKQMNLFQPYTDSGRKGLRGERSVGLGLSICKKIIEHHKGSISVKSKEGKGTVFLVQI